MAKISPTPDELPFCLARATLGFRRFNDQTLSAVGLQGFAPGLASVLHALERLGKCTIGQLALATQFPNGTLTGLVDSLEKEALLKRLANPSDGRSWLLALTPRGRRVCVKLHRRHRLSQALFQETLSSREASQLVRLLDKVTAAMRDYKAPRQKIPRSAGNATAHAAPARNTQQSSPKLP
jgi:DNA-binding MarR family transcriptional regulator